VIGLGLVMIAIVRARRARHGTDAGKGMV